MSGAEPTVGLEGLQPLLPPPDPYGAPPLGVAAAEDDHQPE